MKSHKLDAVSLVLQASFYFAAGVNHFVHTAIYVKIMPPHYSRPELLVLMSGAAEIAGGLGLLLPTTSRVAAIGIIVMLIVYLDVHWYMALNTQRFAPVPPWLIYARLPLQAVLIAWAWLYVRRPVSRS